MNTNADKSSPQTPADGTDHASATDQVIGVAFRRSLIVMMCVAVVVGVAMGVWWLIPGQRVDGVESEPVRAVIPARPALPLIAFTNVTREAGVSFVHESGAMGEKLLPETMGGGCAFFDADGDGDQDILLVGAMRWPWTEEDGEASGASLALYLNDGAGRYTDATVGSGLDVMMYGMGAAVGDYDNDGLVDVYVTAVGTNKLFRNRGGGRFEDVTASAGVAGAGDEDGWHTSAAFLDYDRDGDLDLFVCRYVNWSREVDLAQGFQLTGVGRAYGPPVNFEGTHSTLYRNEGGERFTDVSKEAGIEVRHGEMDAPMGKGLAVAVIDLEGDGWLDIIVANDTVRNFVFRNAGDGTFEEIGEQTGIAYDASGKARGAMGIDGAQLGGPGDRRVVAIGNFANEMTAFYVARDGALRFTDDAAPMGIGSATRLALTFGLYFFDADLDGRLDLLAANGHIEEEIHLVQASQHYRQAAQLFLQMTERGRTRFELMGHEQLGSDFLEPIVGRGAAYADIDSDGDLDVLLTQIDGPPLLLRNDQALGRHFIRFKLLGTCDNRDAIGANVEVRTGEEIIRRTVMPARSYLSQVELPVTIGLGEHTKVDEVRVIWPNGVSQTLDDYVIDGETIVRQP